MLLRLVLKLKRDAAQARVEVETRCYSDSRVGFEDAKLLRPAFELEREATQTRVLMINATATFSVNPTFASLA